MNKEDIKKRFNKPREKVAKHVTYTREEIADHVRNFEANGGKIITIPFGVSSGTDVGTPIHLATDFKNVRERNYMARRADAEKARKSANQVIRKKAK